MKAISIQQPWAWLIINRLKDVENRTWATKVRGKVLIHASRQFDRYGYVWLRQNMPGVFKQMPLLCGYDFGGIVGEAEISDCVTRSTSTWFFGPYGFVISEAKPLPFVLFPGQLKFFDVPWPQTQAEVAIT